MDFLIFEYLIDPLGAAVRYITVNFFRKLLGKKTIKYSRFLNGDPGETDPGNHASLAMMNRFIGLGIIILPIIIIKSL